MLISVIWMRRLPLRTVAESSDPSPQNHIPASKSTIKLTNFMTKTNILPKIVFVGYQPTIHNSGPPQL